MHRMIIGHAALLACFTSLIGCAMTETSNTKRTATEQMLISNAIDQSLAKADFAPFAGHRVFLDAQYVDAVDKQYLVASTRHHLLRSKASLVDSVEDSDIVLELRSGAVGTDTADSFVGVPELTLPGLVTLPEVRLVDRISQVGTAKIGMVAYDSRTHKILGSGGVSLARSDSNNWFVLGFGPIQEGSLPSETSRGLATPTMWPAAHFPVRVAFESPEAVEEPKESGKLQLAGEKQESELP